MTHVVVEGGCGSGDLACNGFDRHASHQRVPAETEKRETDTDSETENDSRERERETATGTYHIMQRHAVPSKRMRTGTNEANSSAEMRHVAVRSTSSPLHGKWQRTDI